MTTGLTETAKPVAAMRPRYYLRAVLFAFAALVIGFATFVYRVSSPDEDALSFWVAMTVFMLAAPALHVASIFASILGLRRGDGRLAGFAALLVNMILVGLGGLLGAAALIGASA